MSAPIAVGKSEENAFGEIRYLLPIRLSPSIGGIRFALPPTNYRNVLSSVP
jgi:hypothetical protein